MGFDPQNAGQPLVNPHKRTTQVNIAVALGVLVFLALSAMYLIHKKNHPEPDAREHPPAVGH
jgi:hypothetical protein